MIHMHIMELTPIATEIDRHIISAIELHERNLDKLRKGVSLFIFQKKDGSLRKCIGTLNETTIPKEYGDEVRKYHKPSPINQTFYDLQLNEFRSYNIDSLVAIIDF